MVEHIEIKKKIVWWFQPGLNHQIEPKKWPLIWVRNTNEKKNTAPDFLVIHSITTGSKMT